MVSTRSSDRLLGALLCLLACTAATVLSGCATPRHTAETATTGKAANLWSGRLAITVQGPAPQSFSASFDLQGDADQGQLQLYSPLGTTLAELRWNAQGARLRRGGQDTQGDSVQALLHEVTGAELPVRALFEWLQGREGNAPGWTADAAQFGQGRLRIRRTGSAPEVDLRIVLD